MNWVNVAKVEAFEDDHWQVIELDDDPVAVVKLQGKFYAFHDICTHDGGILTGGDIEGDEIICPRHGAAFNIKTGACTCPPAYEDIHIFPVRIENGMVQVKDDRE